MGIGAAKQHPITIDGDACSVHTVQRGKTWAAHGSFRNHHIEGTGRTESEALNNWRKKANYRANE